MDQENRAGLWRGGWNVAEHLSAAFQGSVGEAMRKWVAEVTGDRRAEWSGVASTALVNISAVLRDRASPFHTFWTILR